VVAILAGALGVGLLLRFVDPRVTTVTLALAGAMLLVLSLPLLGSMEDVLGLRVFLRGVPILADLSRPLIDEIAPRFETVNVPAGTDIVREGEPGDRLYIVRHGEVEVRVGNHVVRKLGPAGYFGEVALLRSVPRTASVRTRTPTQLYSLDRAAFQTLLHQADDLEPRLTGRAATQYVYASPLMPR
jgi:signal-transduction protein with cAMP-binding, CBS, and nucleotidyltransferase domain